MPTTFRAYIDEMFATEAPPSPPIRALGEALAAEDGRLFARLFKAMDWSTCTPDEIDQATRMAVSLGMAKPASALAQRGIELYPDSELLQRNWRVLAAPPVVRVGKREGPPRKGIQESMNWLNEHADEYRGQWVAVNQGRLLGAAPTLEELDQLTAGAEDPESTITHWVIP